MPIKKGKFANRVTEPWSVLLSNTLWRFNWALACSFGWMKSSSVRLIIDCAWGPRWARNTGSTYRKRKSSVSKVQSRKYNEQSGWTLGSKKPWGSQNTNNNAFDRVLDYGLENLRWKGGGDVDRWSGTCESDLTRSNGWAWKSDR